jgi:hypothetical protein
MAAVVTGNTANFEGAPNSRFIQGNRLTIGYTFFGAYATLKAAEPAIGALPSGGGIIAGCESGSAVESVRTDRLDDGRGVMYVTMAIDKTVVSATLIRSLRQVLSVPFDRPIQDHPALASIYDDFNGWMQETDAGLKQAYYWRKNAYDPTTLAFTGTSLEQLVSVGQTWAAKVLRGVTQWTDYHLVARLTQYYNAPVAVEACGRGKIETPDGFSSLIPSSGYSWLKTADECVQSGEQWTRIREWTGIQGAWDTDIYAVPT